MWIFRFCQEILRCYTSKIRIEIHNNLNIKENLVLHALFDAFPGVKFFNVLMENLDILTAEFGGVS